MIVSAGGNVRNYDIPSVVIIGLLFAAVVGCFG